jgi:nucleoside-diphosphate-sugar epimerase
MLSALIRGDVFIVHGSGQQTRDFTFAADVVAATIAAMEAPRPASVYNVSGGGEASLRDVIEISEELAGRRLKVHNDAHAVGDVRRTVGDTTRIRRDLCWAPSTTLSEGLAAHIGWLQNSRPTSVGMEPPAVSAPATILAGRERRFTRASAREVPGTPPLRAL